MTHPQLPAAEAPEETDNDDLTQALARVDGRVNVSSTRKVTTLVDKNPEQSLAILRSWLHSGGISD